MGKKNKKKFKKDLFDQDYADISLEEQLKMSMMYEQMLSGKSVDLGFDNKPEETYEETEELSETEVEDSLGAFFGTIAESLGVKNTSSAGVMNDMCIPIDLEEEENHGSLADKLIEGLKVNPEVIHDEEESEEEPVMERGIPAATPTPARKEAPVKMRPVTVQQAKVQALTLEEENEYEDESGDDEDMELTTLDNTFPVIHKDESLGDLIIKDAWDDFKTHSFTFFNMIPANMNYKKSPLYEQMCGFIDFAIAFISGPVLVIKQGNEKFKELVNTVEKLDRERIFFCSKTSETEVGPDGEPAIHFLMYYIDKDSKEELEILFETFEDPENENNKIILDLLYSVYKKAIDRHENPWACYDGLDALIDEKESDDDDIDFVIDLIKNDEDTVLGSSDFDHFMDEFVLPIETFIKGDEKNLGVLYTFAKLLEYTFDTSRPDIKIVNEIIQVPDNFGYTDFGANSVNYHAAASDIVFEEGKPNEESEEQVIMEDTETVSEKDDIDIDDVDDGDDLLSDAEDVDDEDELSPASETKVEPEVPVTKKLGTPTQTQSGIKKFGSTPYQGGPMIIK